METQRAVRKVRPDPVDDRIVLRCIELALKAPTGRTARTGSSSSSRTPRSRRSLGRTYKAAWSVYGRVGRRITAGNQAMKRCRRRRVAGAALRGDPGPGRRLPQGSRVPLAAAAPLAASSYYGSIYPSVQNLLLAARAVGLGASLITLPLLSVVHARRTLGPAHVGDAGPSCPWGGRAGLRPDHAPPRRRRRAPRPLRPAAVKA